MQPPHSESEAAIRLRADRARLDAGARHLAPIGTSNQTKLPGNRYGVDHVVHERDRQTMCKLMCDTWLLGKVTGAARLCAEQRAHCHT